MGANKRRIKGARIRFAVEEEEGEGEIEKQEPSGNNGDDRLGKPQTNNGQSKIEGKFTLYHKCLIHVSTARNSINIYLFSVEVKMKL